MFPSAACNSPGETETNPARLVGMMYFFWEKYEFCLPVYA